MRGGHTTAGAGGFYIVHVELCTLTNDPITLLVHQLNTRLGMVTSTTKPSSPAAERSGSDIYPWLCKALAGTSSGIAATILCSPLDVAKTRIQVQSSAAAEGKYSGVIASLRTIYQEEGFIGWYSGFTPAVCSVGVFWTCYFPCYDYAKITISDFTGLPTSSPVVHLTAAAGAGLVTDVITNPLWVVRTRLATQALGSDGVDAPPLYRSMRHAFRRIAAEEGPLAFFSGLSASLLGLSHIMIQFPLYERLKADLAGYRERPGPLAPATSAPEIMCAAGISKLVASTITYPHEVVRARLQHDGRYRGLIDATVQTFRAEGLGGFWLGFRLNIVRTIPQARAQGLGEGYCPG